MGDIFELVKYYESLHDGDLKTIGLQPKICPAGYWTIGYGRVIKNEKGEMLTYKTPYKNVLKYTLEDENEALAFLKEDFEDYRKTVKQNIHPSVFLKKYEEDSLTSFCYNVGKGNFSKSTLVKLLNKNDRVGAANELLKWCKAKDPKTGKMIILKGLEKRRKAEKHFFETGTVKLF
jgi:lysozyme